MNPGQNPPGQDKVPPDKIPPDWISLGLNLLEITLEQNPSGQNLPDSGEKNIEKILPGVRPGDSVRGDFVRGDFVRSPFTI